MSLIEKKFAVKYFLVPLPEKVMYTVDSPVIFWNKEREAMRQMLKAVIVLVREDVIETCNITEFAG